MVKNSQSLLKRLQDYLRESQQEAKKVTWPDRKYVLAATGVVIVIVMIMTLLITGVDYLFAKLFGFIFHGSF